MPFTHHHVDSTFAALIKTARNVPLHAGIKAENFFRDNFRQQGFMGDNGLQRWRKRKGEKTNRLLLTGRQGAKLMHSLKKTVTGTGVVIKPTGSAAKYADAHNFGQTQHIPVTQKLRRYAWAMYYKTGEQKWKHMALTRKSTITIKLPARPFIGPSQMLNQQLITMFNNKMKLAPK